MQTDRYVYNHIASLFLLDHVICNIVLLQPHLSSALEIVIAYAGRSILNPGGGGNGANLTLNIQIKWWKPVSAESH